MRVTERLSGIEQLEALRGAWRELIARAPDASAFQTLEWIGPWWATFGTGRLHVLVERSSDGIHAAAPMFVRDACPGAASSPLTLIGTGNSDRMDVIAGSRIEAERIAQAAEAEADRLQLSVDWRRLPGSSPLAWACGCGAITDESPCPVVALPLTSDGLDGQLTRVLRRSISSGRRHLSDEGPVTFELLKGSDVNGGLDELFLLHAARWEREGGRGVLGEAGVQCFHRAVAAGLDRSGELRLVRMRVGTDTAAVYYGFRTGSRECAYISGFNPRFSDASPGSVLIREVMRRAIDEGTEFFDFLSGREPYKYAWSAHDERFVARCFDRLPGTAIALTLPSRGS